MDRHWRYPSALGTGMALAVAMLLLVIIRAWIPFDAVFRGQSISLVGNDPYFYRYWVEQLLTSQFHPLNPFDLDQIPSDIRQHDVLMIWVVWLFATALGGTAYDAGLVLAWYPVFSAMITAGLVYTLAILVIDDRRVALLSVGVLALTPAHAYRTMLGFGDHHAFDYLAMTLTATTLVWLSTFNSKDQPRTRRSWQFAVIILGGSVAAQSLAWRAGPLLLAPVVGFVVLASLSSLNTGRSPLQDQAGLLAGLLIGAGLAALVHLGLDWAPGYRGFAPLILLCGAVSVVGIAELAHRFDRGSIVVVLSLPIISVFWAALFGTLLPSVSQGVDGFLAFIERRSQQQALGIGETASLAGSIELPIELFGFILLLVIPVLIISTLRSFDEYQPGWLVLAAYTWLLVAFSINRIRFTGQLAIFTAVLGAVGIVWLAAQMDRASSITIARRESGLMLGQRPIERVEPYRTGTTLVAILVLVTAIGVAQVPSTMDRITVDDETYAAAQWMDEYSDQQGLSYPENYVFSEWGRNRFYNYEVSSESRSYGFAQRNYRRFVLSTRSEEAYEGLRGRVGFIVIRGSRFEYPSDSMQTVLDARFGSAGDGVPGVAHYRFIYASEDQSLKVFTLVPGATITGSGTPNSTIEVVSHVEVENITFTYRRSVPTDANGDFAVTVPYAGRYRVGSQSVSISDTAVTNGDTVEV